MTDNQTKIAVLVSGGGTNLQALIDAEQRGELGGGKITLVIASKPGVYALERAASAGIEGRVLARKDYDSIAAYSKALADEMHRRARHLDALGERRLVNVEPVVALAAERGNEGGVYV